MIKDTSVGVRDKRGFWRPNKKIDYGPVLVWPFRVWVFLKWLLGYPGFILPWNLLYICITIFAWMYLTPSIETMKTLSIDWMVLVFLRNVVLTILVVGAWYFFLYMKKTQNTEFKYNQKWPQENKSSIFLFKNQTFDSIFWTFASGVPIWSLYETVMLWLYSSGRIPWIDPTIHPIWFILLIFLTPVIHEIHFYFAHRLTHVKFLYKWVHYLHHRYINPEPWSGIAMHPVEHIIYFAGIFLFALIPSHPLHMMFIAMRLGLGPSQGHTGFDKIVTGKDSKVEIGIYNHYLHHKYFEVNYSDGIIPLDKWFGSFHDGSVEADLAIQKRLDRYKLNSNDL